MSIRKDLARINENDRIQRAEATLAAQRAGEQEQIRLARAAFRIAGAYDLAELATIRATGLNSLKSRDPRLRAIHEHFEETAAVTSSSIIYRYGVGQ